MDEKDFAGTLVLERLAEIGQVEDFFDAIDSDDVQRAVAHEEGQGRRIYSRDGRPEDRSRGW